MKLIAVSLSNRCSKNPRCKFCYASNEPDGNTFDLWYSLADLNRKYPKTTFCFEYSGYNLSTVYKFDYENVKKTMTTMPSLITDIFCKAMKKQHIKAISLSYDSQKCTLDEWLEKSKIIKKNRIKLGCNYLIESIPSNVPEEILRTCDQLNLLVLKPTGKLSDKQINVIELEIEKYKNYCKVTTDNCLGVQLGLVDCCKSGIDFIHVYPNGKVDNCCFKKNCYLFNKLI